MERDEHDGDVRASVAAPRMAGARPAPGIAPRPAEQKRRRPLRRLVNATLVVAFLSTLGLAAVTMAGRTTSSKFSSVASAICGARVERDAVVPTRPLGSKGPGPVAGVVPAVTGWSIEAAAAGESASGGCGGGGSFDSSSVARTADAPGSAASSAPAPNVSAAKPDASPGPAASASTPGQPSFAVKAFDPGAANPAAAGHAFVSTATVRVRAGDDKTEEAAKPGLVASKKEQAILLVEAAGGGLFGEQSSFDGQAKATVTLKVPPASFRSMLSELAKLGFLESSEVKTDDVTDQVIDVGARITAAQNGLERTRGLLAKSSNLVEVNSLENEVSRRETEVETLLGQQKTLSQRVDLATIVFTVVGAPAPVVSISSSTTTAPPATPATALPGFSDGLQGGWRVFTNVGTVVLAMIGAVLPFLPVVIVTAFAWRVLRHRRATGAPVPRAT